MSETAAKVGGWAAVITGGTVLLAAFITAAIAVRAFLIKTLWNWFIPDALGLPALGWEGAIGLSLVWAAVHGYRKDAKDDETPGRTLLFALVVQPLLLLGLGWVVKAVL